ncbi:MAG: AMP-binding protein [Clostridia bacterium]|nr:AMP-binding protein [Clostridia bacterium]
MDTNKTASQNQLSEVASRIKEMREILGMSAEETAKKTELSLEQYLDYESGAVDLPFTFIYKCAGVFGIELTDLLEGHSAKLSSYTVTRRGKGQLTAREDGIEISNLAPLFRNKIAEPYWVKYEYSEDLQSRPIHTTTHSGQEFDLVISGKLKVQVGEHITVLGEGDSIYYDSSTPHGMIAVDGGDCVFCAVVLPGEHDKENDIPIHKTVINARASEDLLVKEFIECDEDENGVPTKFNFKNTDRFNFAFDTVDAIADKYPDKLAMLHVSNDFTERRFSFRDIKRASNQCANYFKSLGIKRGDKVMLILKRHYQFWFSMIALHKLGAVAIPATNQLLTHDIEYRFNTAGVSAIVCTADGNTADYVEEAEKNCPTLKTKIIVNGTKEGWHNFNEEYELYSTHFKRQDDSPCGNDTMVMFFTSGTSGYPKIASHSYKYALGHYATAKYWHYVQSDGLHFTISETGWGKALWGKLYGQWMCEGAVFVYDFDRFKAQDILPMFKKYNITTFCAPPTMYRMLIKDDLSQYDLSSIKHATTAGEALNPEVFYQFEKATGLSIREGFGQTETTLTIANLLGDKQKVGSMGKPVSSYDLTILDRDGRTCGIGETGEICIRADINNPPCGLFKGYYNDPEKTAEVWHDGYYHTGDEAWRDEDGYYWYIGRADDVIKSSGYRIGPFEIENVIMELPYVLECGVSAAPDEIRGQVVKASIVLTKGTEPTEELKKEIQNYVKTHTAPYKYPRIVVFRDELPKTISGKIIRNKL